MKALLLGPHPGHGSFSIDNYFAFYAGALPKALPDWEIVGKLPGRPRLAGGASTRLQRLRVQWENFVRWPLHLTISRGDLIHILDQGLAWYGEFVNGGRRLISIHDLINYMISKGSLDFGSCTQRRKLLLSRCVRQIQAAHHLVSVSNCTAGHLVSMLEIPASKITVVPNVLEDDLSPLQDQERRVARRRWFGDAEYVVIHVGKASAYKNRIGAMRSFGLLHEGLPLARLFLVHGRPDAEETAFLKESSARDAIKFLPPMTREELRQFYGAADALIFPSLYEGFGWPPLEAMACGCPVVCTTRGSLREVVGDAALTTDDPHDHRALAEQLRLILRDGTAARHLQRRGFARAKCFTASTILPQMADVYRRM